VAARVLGTAGIEGSTIRDVAAAGGWSTTMVTHYFATKDELLLHTLAASITEMTAAIEEAQRAGVDELRSIIEQILPLDAARTARWRLWLAFWGRAIGSDELASLQREHQRELVERLDAALRRRSDTQKRSVSFDPRRLVALLDGVAVQAVFAPDEWPPGQQLAQFDDLLSS